MLMQKERELIVAYGKRMLDEQLTTGTGGNISIFNRELQLMAISPSGLEYYHTKPEDVVILNTKGEVVEGKHKASSEWYMHLIYYLNREDVCAVVHTHSKYATTLACLGKAILPVHYMIALAGYEVPVADYAIYGSKELAENALKATEDRNAVLLANHGLMALGEDLESTYAVALHLEYVAEIYYRCLASGQEAVLLSNEQLTDVMKKFKSYRYR